jgi:predicted esterase
MSQANVVTSAGNIAWYTDKAEVVTGSTPVTYNVYALSTTQPLAISGSTTNSSNVLVTTSARASMVNATVTGANVPASTTVSGFSAGANLVLSASATGNTSGNFTVKVANPGNIYSNAVQIAANSRQQIFVGAGNYLTITGSNWTARELGTASSAQSSIFGQA